MVSFPITVTGTHVLTSWVVGHVSIVSSTSAPARASDVTPNPPSTNFIWMSRGTIARGVGSGAFGVVSGIVSVIAAGGSSVPVTSSSWESFSRTWKFVFRKTICLRSWNSSRAGGFSVGECVVTLSV